MGGGGDNACPGSLDECMDACPSNDKVFKICVASCSKRCSSSTGVGGAAKRRRGKGGAGGRRGRGGGGGKQQGSLMKILVGLEHSHIKKSRKIKSRSDCE